MHAKWKIAIVTHAISALLAFLLFCFGLMDTVKTADTAEDIPYAIAALVALILIIAANFITILGILRISRPAQLSKKKAVVQIVFLVLMSLYTIVLLIALAYSIYLSIRYPNLHTGDREMWQAIYAAYTLLILWNTIMQFMTLRKLKNKSRRDLEAMIAAIGSESPLYRQY